MELNRELYIKGVSDYLENGKNLLKLTDGTYENNGITVVVSNGIITINGTATNTSFISIPYAFANLTLYSGKTYTLSCNNTTIASGGLSVRPIGDLGTFQADLGRTNSTSTTTISSNQTGTYLLIRSNSGVVANNVVVKPQLEEGPIATNFELYNGGYASKDYLENGKNLFNKNNYGYLNAYINSTGPISQDANFVSIICSVKPNTTFTLTKPWGYSGTSYAWTNKIAFYQDKPTASSTPMSVLSLGSTEQTEYTFTTPANCNYILFGLSADIRTTHSDWQDYIQNIQLEEGSEATPYEEYYGKYLNKGDGILIPYTLYDNSSGSTGNITLSDNVKNYKYIEIYYKDEVNAILCQKTYNNSAILTISRFASDGANFQPSRTIQLSQNTITTTRYGKVVITNSGSVSVSATNNIYITRVIGYK